MITPSFNISVHNIDTAVILKRKNETYNSCIYKELLRIIQTLTEINLSRPKSPGYVQIG